jgi:hypothetical protein
MPTQTFMREAVVTGVDAFAKLTGGGDGTTLQDIVVPSWAHSIKAVKAGVGVDGAAAAANILVSLRGATQYGDQILAMGSYTNIGTTVALAQAVFKRDVDVPVVPDKSLEIWACIAGGDSGSPEVQVEVTFSEKAGSHAYLTRNAALTTVDVWQTLNTENGTTAVNDALVQGKMIDQVWATVGLSPTTQEPHQVAFRLQGVSGSIAGNEHTFTTSSNLISDGTLADGCLDTGVVNDVAIAVTKGTLRIQGVDSSATSTADPELAVTVCFAM